MTSVMIIPTNLERSTKRDLAVAISLLSTKAHIINFIHILCSTSDMDPQLLHAFQQEFEAATGPEDKLQLVNQYIRKLVEQTHSSLPLSIFWKLREHSTPLFAQDVASKIRQELWNEYRQLCQEYRRVRSVADEQAQFAAEQIQLTVQSLENELMQIEANVTGSEDLPIAAQTVQHHYAEYQLLQKELNFLNMYASRITGLRKELIRIEMRPRIKHKLFQELSKLGERIFPRRKELIKLISDLFIHDVDQFVRNFFPLHPRSQFFELREEIKQLQLCAKLFTLNTAAFTVTRTQLTDCWETLRQHIQERRVEQQERRQQDQIHLQSFDEQLADLGKRIEEGEVALHNFEEHHQELSRYIDQLPIHRNEKKIAKDRLFKAVASLVEKQDQQAQELKEKAQAAERARLERIALFRQAIDNTLAEGHSLDLETLMARNEELTTILQSLPTTKSEKIILEKLLRPLKELIFESREKALLHLSADDLEMLQQLRHVLQQRLERRREVKNHVEELRRAQASASLNFEKALAVHEQIQQERDRLEKLDMSIREIEEKIAEFSSKLI